MLINAMAPSSAVAKKCKPSRSQS